MGEEARSFVPSCAEGLLWLTTLLNELNHRFCTVEGYLRSKREVQGEGVTWYFQ